MIANVEIISSETIKPSLPTPNHLRKYDLCVLDQLIPADEAPLVIFYPNNDASTHLQVFEKIALLKKSLSETLTRYYPLAGSIANELSIECDDRGACFVTAEVKHLSLNEFLKNPDLKFIDRFLPLRGSNEVGSYPITNVQASVFACGGIALGICISHRVLDGTALSVFLKSWADNANYSSGEKTLTCPDFSASSLFQVDDLKLKEASMKMWLSLFKKGNFVTRRFVFESSAIATLKDMAKDKTLNNPTRVETVSGFISKCVLDSCDNNPGSKSPSLITHIVNLRKRASPNFPESSLGNLVWIASASTKHQHGNLRLSTFAGEIRKSISKIDGDYVKKLRSDEGKNTMVKYLREMEEMGSKGANQLGFTSWCKLGFYDIDFGWGKPVWVSSIDVNAPYFMNLVVLIDTRCGDGIEAWVTVDEEGITRLESNQEFRRFASFNPSPLQI